MRCKMCGGSLRLEEGATVAECEYCGTRQTVPRADSQRKLAMFERAGQLLQECEFDRAAGLYEALAAEFPQEAEAYWGMVLCRYGIEYVDDPLTGKKVPTCHRSSYDSVLKNSNYRLACSHGSPEARALYEQEAARLEQLRTGILQVSAREEPYDLFLCCKESEDNGDRTTDSVLAQELYGALTERGWRVFFSRISLEDKLGTAFEPYIFGALRSARGMVVLGTSRAHLEAVWVRNEWSRFLALMETDPKKFLIPCYHTMDARELPQEFSRLQAQDLSRVGAVQDLLYGVEKLMGKPPRRQPPRTTDGNALLERGRLALEDREWEEADQFFEQVLNQDPHSGAAYLGKFCVEQRLSRLAELADPARRENPEALRQNRNYERAVRFGGAPIREELETAFRAVEEQKHAAAYETACGLRDSAETPSALDQAAAAFDRLDRFRDAAVQAADCRKKAQALREEARRQEQERIAAEEARKEAERQKKEAERLQKLEEKRRRQEKRQQRSQTPRPARPVVARAAQSGSKGPILAAAAAGTVLLAGALLMKPVILPTIHYHQAQTLLQGGSYEEALQTFRALRDYKDSENQALACQYAKAEALFRDGSYEEARAAFVLLGDYRDSRTQVPDCDYLAALDLLQEGKTDQARAQFQLLGDYKDAAEQILACDYAKAQQLLDQGETEEAEALLETLHGYEDSTAQVQELQLNRGRTLLDKGQIGEAYAELQQCGPRGEEILRAFWKERLPKPQPLAVCTDNTAGLRTDGTAAIATVESFLQRDVAAWTDLKAIAVSSLYDLTLGLRSDGTVVASGQNQYGECNVGDWTDICAIAAGEAHAVGLRTDGTVVAVGNNDFGECNVADWTNIVAIAANFCETVGLRADGTVLTAGKQIYGQRNVGDWTDVVAIVAGHDHTVGLRSDGTVLAAGWNGDGRCNVEGWTDVIAVDAGRDHTVGLRSDGTVLATGENDYGQCNVGDWTDVVAIAAGWEHTVGLRADGTVLATGVNEDGQCSVEGWTDVIVVAASRYHTVGLRADGTVLAVGSNYYSQCNVSDWTGIKVPEARLVEEE